MKKIISCLILIELYFLIILIMAKRKEKFSRKKHNKNGKKTKRKVVIEKIIKKCNNILVNKDPNCNCKNKKGYPTEDIKKCIKTKKGKECQNYNLCKRFFKL